MSRTLFFDCSYGISGDMTLGALLHLGASFAQLCEGLRALPIAGYALSTRTVMRDGISALQLQVKIDPAHPDNQKERTRDDLLDLILGCNLPQSVRENAARSVRILADAEAIAHQIPASQVIFHETGAVDTIIDLVGTALCLEMLSPDQILSTPLSDGVGQIRCRRGIIPVPVPAVRILTQTFQIPTRSLPIQSELVTPTGASIAACYFSGYQTHPKPDSLVAGAGEYEYGEGGYLRCGWL